MDEKHPSSIGSLTRKISDTLKSTGSIRPESSKTSEAGQPTSGLQARPASETREDSGNCGVGAKLTVIHGGTVEGRDNELLTSIARLCGSQPEEIRKNHYDEFGFDSELVGYRIEGMSATVEQQIRALIAEANPPLDAKKAIPMLHAMAKAMPSQDGSDAEAWGELVLMALEDVPAEVVIEAAKRIVKREKWRPTPAEIREECLWLSRKRRALMRVDIG